MKNQEILNFFLSEEQLTEEIEDLRNDIDVHWNFIELLLNKIERIDQKLDKLYKH